MESKLSRMCLTCVASKIDKDRASTRPERHREVPDVLYREVRLDGREQANAGDGQQKGSIDPPRAGWPFNLSGDRRAHAARSGHSAIIAKSISAHPVHARAR